MRSVAETTVPVATTVGGGHGQHCPSQVLGRWWPPPPAPQICRRVLELTRSVFLWPDRGSSSTTTEGKGTPATVGQKQPADGPAAPPSGSQREEVERQQGHRPFRLG